MKEKETTLRIRNNPNHQGSRIFEQSDPNVKVRNAKKRITPPKKEEKNKTQLKMFPISKAKVASLLKSQDLNEELDYSEKKESLRINVRNVLIIRKIMGNLRKNL